MSLTVDCGEGKHDLCSGTGRTAYLVPQDSRALDEPPFNCGCRCHRGQTQTQTSREHTLLEGLRNERQRWHELRRYAIETGDRNLMAFMDQASERYRERSVGGGVEQDQYPADKLPPWINRAVPDDSPMG